jgi:hypothetical protein
MQPPNIERMRSALSEARSRGAAALSSGLDNFSSGWQKAKGLFERDADEPEEDRSNWSEAQVQMQQQKDDEQQYQINKIAKRYNDKIKYEKDPLEKKRLEIERDAKIRKLAGKKMSAAEQFMLGKGGDFMAGVNSTSDDDIVKPGYKTYDLENSPDEIARAKAYNKKLEGLSGRWSKPAAAIGKGLGAFAASSVGGIPGLLAGAAIGKGIPMAADWLMNRSARNHEEEDAMERKYNPNRL